ncbi:phosphatidylinositide phosphatase SAC2-like [Diadema setosum]|uniref:phosphatidylinositide phosphatase SAC2-like n=1 Tax=Diadema setosum TaxID=31175 RepID=UPI003B3A436F
MELHQTDDNYIIQDKDFSLWCSRVDGKLTPQPGSALVNAWNPVCLGKVLGVIGKIRIHPESEWRLLLIRSHRLVGQLPRGHDVYCITRIAVLPLSQNGPPDIDIERCDKHHFGIKQKTNLILGPVEGQQKALAKTWNTIKSAAQVKKKEVKEREKLERRILEELNRMFTESDWFYYSPTGDLTNSIQRQHTNDKNSGFDERFFWNQHMLQDVLDCQDKELAKPWTIPVVQGCVQIRECRMSFGGPEEGAQSGGSGGDSDDSDIKFNLMLISRRSKYRAGTRYRRRGIDSYGACANYVETEQILQTAEHSVSFVQVRGSVPVFWSQPGIKYKPPPRIDREDDETQEAFKTHFEEQLKLYRHVAIVSLIEQAGREAIVGSAFMKHVLMYDSSKLTYITFDFHEYCRGMRFDRVSVLLESIRDVIKEMRYCWADAEGVILEQRGVFRVNCMDCLDRTNVVQTALARVVLRTQLRKLGLLLPDQSLIPNIRSIYQDMWANNGDVISRQYAGTAALKGDYTRTGERKFTGLMKDGYNSANRYVQNQFKDAFRQVAIDLMLGNQEVQEDLSVIDEQKASAEMGQDVWDGVDEEDIKQRIQQCSRLLLPKTEARMYLGGWALIDCDSGDLDDNGDDDRDILLIISEKAYYIASYDDEAEKITQYERIPIDAMTAVGIGSATTFFSHAKQRCVRIYHSVQGEEGYFSTLKALPSQSKEAAEDILHAVVEALAKARAANNLGLKVVEDKMEKKKSKTSQEVIRLTSQKRFTMWLQDKFVPESVLAKRNRGNVSNQPQSSPGTNRQLIKPIRAQVMSRYFQSMGDKVANLNPLKKVRLRKRQSIPQQESGGVENQGFSGEQGSQDALDGIVISDSDDEILDTSSSDTSYDSMSLGDCLEILGGNAENVDDDPLNASMLSHDGEVILTTCGVLAVDQERNKRSLSLRRLTSRKGSRRGETPSDNANPVGRARLMSGDSHVKHNALRPLQSMTPLGNSDETDNSSQDVFQEDTVDGSQSEETSGNVSDSHQGRPSIKSPRKNQTPIIHLPMVEDHFGTMDLTVNPLPENFHDHLLVDSPHSPINRAAFRAHSENSLQECFMSTTSTEKTETDSLEREGAQAAITKIALRFRNLGTINFNRMANLRAEQQKEQMQMEMKMRRECKTRFIQL